MKYIEIVIFSLASLIVLFLLTKLMGKKQISQLTMFDYIIGISIGSIAAETATDLENPIKGLLAMTIYAFSAFLISFFTQKFLPFRRIMFGKSTFIIKEGKLCSENLKKIKLDLSEFLMECRTAGYFDISDIAYAISEPNGKISFLPLSAKRPATPDDLKVLAGEDTLPYNVILDGEILYNNLKSLGFNKEWLITALKAQGFKNHRDIFLATADKDGTLTVFETLSNKNLSDPFQ